MPATLTPAAQAPPMPRTRVPAYLLAAHPNWRESRVTRRLLDAARSLEGVEVNDLYGSYPDYSIDVAAEQARAASAELIVLLHPVHWYSMPALLKLWVDEVLALGWAYGHGGTALRGKSLWLVASTGGPAESYRPEGYNRHRFEDFLPPYEQTAALCGMRFLPPLVLHGAHRADDAAIAGHARAFLARLETYPDWAQAAGEEGGCDVPDIDRPRHAEA